MFKFINKFLDLNQKEITRLKSRVDQINSLSDKYSKLKKSEDFSTATAAFKKLLADGTALDSLLPDAFALVREASMRSIGLRAYDVQLMAAIAFHEGKIAEQKTGEGKTLSAIPALYLNALTGKGCHLVTVNDYLARRDAGWNAPVFHLLGLTTSVVIQDPQLRGLVYDPDYTEPEHDDERLRHLKPISRQQAYLADITYGTNTEFGFDYLRDNMSRSPDQQNQRGHHYAIVDEVDSILVDEARTPLIISMPYTEPTDKYYQFQQLVNRLSSDTDYSVDEKLKSATLTEHGIKK